MRALHINILVSSLLTLMPSVSMAVAYIPLDNEANARRIISQHSRGDVDKDPYRNIGYSGLNTLNSIAYKNSKDTALSLLNGSIERTRASLASNYANTLNIEVADINDLVDSYSNVVGTEDINNALYLNTYKAILDNSHSRYENALKGGFSTSSILSSYNQTHNYRLIILNKNKAGVVNVTNEYQSIYDTRKENLHDLMQQGINRYQSKYNIARQAIIDATRYTNCSNCSTGPTSAPVAMDRAEAIEKIDLEDIQNDYCTSYTHEGTGPDKLSPTIKATCI